MCKGRYSFDSQSTPSVCKGVLLSLCLSIFFLFSFFLKKFVRGISSHEERDDDDGGFEHGSGTRDRPNAGCFHSEKLSFRMLRREH